MCVCSCPGAHYKAGLKLVKEVAEEIDPVYKLLGSPEEPCMVE